MTPFDVGSILADRYRLDALLGRGGMGSVWRAHHLTLNSPVAIKLIDPAIAAHQVALERFMREAQAAAALRSPHVVQTFDYGVHDGVPYIAMELMEGESLAARLERCRRLSPAETLKVLTHVARAVGKAHDTGIVHRDLKPDNIFIVHNDDEEVAKVLDFGIAKLTGGSLGSASQTRTGAVIGTPYYMSPEQVEGTRAVDHRTDVWAIGVIAYECLLGVRPFDGEAIGELILRICTKPIPVPSSSGVVPAGFDVWFARACCRELDARFGSVREMVDGLRALLSGDVAMEGPEPASDLERSSSATSLGRTTGAPLSRSASIPPKSSVVPALAMGGGIVAVVLASLAVYLLTDRAPRDDAAIESAEQVAAQAPRAAPPLSVHAPKPAPEPISTASVSPPATAAPAPSRTATLRRAPKPATLVKTAPQKNLSGSGGRTDFGF